MNISKIYNAQINNVYSIRNSNSLKPQYGIKMTQPIQNDIVSFQGRGVKAATKEIQAALARKEARALRDAKQIAESKLAPGKTAPTKKNLSGEERKWGVSKSTAIQIREMILEPQKQIHDFLARAFGDLKVSELSPKNILLDFLDRAKSTISIMEKSSTREWNSIKEILDKMTDLNGGKLVLNFKTGKADAETVLDRLIPLIRTKQITLHEIELQRPSEIKKMGKKEQEEFDYVSKQFLDKLEDAQEEVLNGLETDVDKIQLIDRPLPKYTKFNYCALHLLLQLNEKGSRPFELQIMGPRMAKGKSFDDKRFKFFDGKELDKKYKKLIMLWKPLMADENQEVKEEFLRYCKEANFQLRLDEIQEHNTQKQLYRPTGFFKTVRDYNLTPGYDLNKQYKTMLECETAKISKTESDVEIDTYKLVKEHRRAILSSKGTFNKILSKLHLDKSEKKIKN